MEYVWRSRDEQVSDIIRTDDTRREYLAGNKPMHVFRRLRPGRMGSIVNHFIESGRINGFRGAVNGWRHKTFLSSFASNLNIGNRDPEAMINSRRGQRHKRQDASKRSKKAVKKYDPQQPQARDEGPRLIPLGTRKAEHPFQHYLDLADVALNNKKKTS